MAMLLFSQQLLPNSKRFGAYFILLVSILLLVSCDNSSRYKRDIKGTKQDCAARYQNAKSITKLPATRRAAQHTNFIGTINHPTIDGGIINSADAIPVNFFVPTLSDTSFPSSLASYPVNKFSSNVSSSTTAPAKNAISSSSLSEQSLGAIRDSWATSARVKNLLATAARNGRLDYVLRKLEEKQLPASLATVPMIESNYQGSVTSAKGAAGVWQLMPRTAQDYGLEKSERYKFATATEAALNLLTNLRQQFNSWELAFAAYNAGAKRVQDALRKNPHANNVQELDLPQETKNYVARVMVLNEALDRGEL